MDNLRLILIVTGICILAAIYLWDRIQKRKTSRHRIIPPEVHEEEMPALVIRRGSGADEDFSSELADLNSFLSQTKTEREAGRNDPPATPSSPPGGKILKPDPAEFSAEPGPAPKTASPATPRADPAEADVGPENLIMLHVAAPGAREIPGDLIHTALQGLGFRYGDMRIFHHYGTARLKADTPLFSVVNMYEPGTFDLDRMSRFSTRGLAVFMRLPSAHDPEAVFEYMLEICRRLAEKIGAEVQGPDRRPLTQPAQEAIIRRLREDGR